MKFFKPSDISKYIEIINLSVTELSFTEHLCEHLNSQLEREGKIIFQHKDQSVIWQEYTNPLLAISHDVENRKKALLIDIEPIEKCTHPKEKIKHEYSTIHSIFRCECGIPFQPKEFEEVK